MRKCLLFVLLIIYSGQSNAFAQEVSLLNQQLQKAKTIKDKLYALDALANYYTYTLGGDSLAELYGNRQINLAIEIKDKELQAIAYNMNGIRLIQSMPSDERFKKAKKWFEKAIDIGKKENLPFYAAAAYLGISRLPYYSFETNGDVALHWAGEALRLSTSINNDSLRVQALVAVAIGKRLKKENIVAFHHYSEALQRAEKLKDPFLLSYCYRAMSDFFWSLGDNTKQIQYMRKAEQALEGKENLSHHELYWLFWVRQNTAYNVFTTNERSESAMNDFNMARVYVNKCLQQAKRYHMPDFFLAVPFNQHYWLYKRENNLAKAKLLLNSREVERFYIFSHWQFRYDQEKALMYQRTGQPDSAAYYFQKAISGKDAAIKWAVVNLYKDYGAFLQEQGKIRQAIEQWEIAKAKSEEYKDLNNMVSSYQALDVLYYKAGNVPKAYEYAKLSQRLKDSLSQLSNERGVALLEVEREQKRLEQEQKDKQALMEYRNQVRTYGLLGGLVVLLFVAAFLYRNNRQKQKANLLLQQQKWETEQQKIKTVQAYEQLKSTQQQLIQREKMASLGELTAGIAHEIKNPLNFINNFSEVSVDILEEVKEEMDAGHISQAKEVMEEVKCNLIKIASHGKRADTIVRGMMEHSQIVKGEPVETDLNALAEEYLRITYQSFRSKDASFNAIIETHYDAYLEKLKVHPQEIGRVLLNLLNNAFYSVQQKKKLSNGSYEPLVQVCTCRKDGRIEVSVKDNGIGIPEKVLSKIYQPFFTTKPTGEGTGLGLSLSYDIITKGHGGSLSVHSTEGEGAEFVIQLPLKEHHQTSGQ